MTLEAFKGDLEHDRMNLGPEPRHSSGKAFYSINFGAS